MDFAVAVEVAGHQRRRITVRGVSVLGRVRGTRTLPIAYPDINAVGRCAVGIETDKIIDAVAIYIRRNDPTRSFKERARRRNKIFMRETVGRSAQKYLNSADPAAGTSDTGHQNVR